MDKENGGRFLSLVHVAINPYTRQSKNETVTFRQNNDDTFVILTGATDCKHGRKKPRNVTFPMSSWDEKRSFYERKGYVVTDTVDRGTADVVVQNGKRPIKDQTFRTLLERLIRLNNEYFEESYSKSVRLVAPEAINKVQNALLELAKKRNSITVKEFNDILLSCVWTYVPRQMNNLDAKIAHRKSDFSDIIQREQELLDMLVQELQTRRAESEQADVLTENHIVERPCTPDEIQKIRSLMTNGKDRFVNAWFIENHDVRQRFDEFCEKKGLTEENGGVQMLWHGTREENIWSIEKNGLYLNPAVIKSDVRISGKAYGYGIYTAPYCYKSMAYTSSNFGNGRHAHGYLLLCRVATGKPYYINRDPRPIRPNHWGDFHKDHPDCDCCWAEAGETANAAMMRLRWDEVIVYREEQIVPSYIIEYSA